MSFSTNQSQQISLFDATENLTDREKRLLEKSWAKYFAENIFPEIEEEPFSVLYSDRPSRHNTPVNVIIGALILKEIFGLTDEEIVETLPFDIRYQYALHTTSFKEQPLNDRTLGRFRARCNSYEEMTGIDLIHDCMEKNDHYKDIRCINIDLHHDFVNDSEEVDCGNWISHLYKDYGDHFKFNWVVNPISREMFDLNEEIFDKTLLKSLADIKIKDFDVVFLCRSDNFFAPHLDPYFDEIVRLIESRFHDIRIEKSVNEVRDYRKYDSMYEKLHRSLKNS